LWTHRKQLLPHWRLAEHHTTSSCAKSAVDAAEAVEDRPRHVPHFSVRRWAAVARCGYRQLGQALTPAGLAPHLDKQRVRRVPEEKDSLRRHTALRAVPVVPAPGGVRLLETSTASSPQQKVSIAPPEDPRTRLGRQPELHNALKTSWSLNSVYDRASSSLEYIRATLKMNLC
jgi:hypothetical protein